MTIIQLIFVKFDVKFLIMIKWHKKQLDKIMKKFGLNTYQIAWISYIKGIIITVILYEYLF